MFAIVSNGWWGGGEGGIVIDTQWPSEQSVIKIPNGYIQADGMAGSFFTELHRDSASATLKRGTII